MGRRQRQMCKKDSRNLVPFNKWLKWKEKKSNEKKGMKKNGTKKKWVRREVKTFILM